MFMMSSSFIARRFTYVFIVLWITEINNVNVLLYVFNCSLQFFYPLIPANIVIQYNQDGRPSGDGDVEFVTDEEARMAMKRNRALMR